MDFTDRPAQRILIASVARRYYLEGRSKVEIGEELGLSRFKVARLLETARDSGLVHIEIADPDMIDVDLSAQLQDAYDLRHAVVVETPDDNPTTLRERIGNAAAELLSEIVTADDVLGLAWSRSVSAMTNALNRLPTIPVVQLSGALVQPDMADSSVDLVRQAARISGGAAHFFYAPTVVSDQATARALQSSPKSRGHSGNSVRLPKPSSASGSGLRVSQRSMTSPTKRFGVSCIITASVPRSPESSSTPTDTQPSRI
jgi:DNA-binding transcriptional regulator LsrR (DeoR family)